MGLQHRELWKGPTSPELGPRELPFPQEWKKDLLTYEMDSLGHLWIQSQEPGLCISEEKNYNRKSSREVTAMLANSLRGP